MSSTHDERLQRARLSLEGLSVGDALGGFFEFANSAGRNRAVATRALPNVQWHFTDDTNMALSIYQNLRLYGEIKQDELALSFAQHFDRGRGYGPSVHRFASRMRKGEQWREVSLSVFGGRGSFGNGGAMRVAPVGAYFADDLEAAVENARRSTEVTHAHPEGVAGAIAVAIAAALAWNLRGQVVARHQFIETVLLHVPGSEVRAGLERGTELPQDATVEHAVKELGNGQSVTAQDTVPYILWCAGEKLSNYEDAIWLTVSGGGDVDTNCAMVGGIVSMYTGFDGIPRDWIQHREPLPDWAFTD